MTGTVSSEDKIRLIVDIGGTNVRLALSTGDGFYRAQATYLTARHAGIAPVITEYLAGLVPPLRPQEALIAVAAPVRGDHVQLTNASWQFSCRALAAQLGFRRVTALNDFAAIALALPYLKPGELQQVGGGTARLGAPIGIIGPGTGLGVAGLLTLPGGELLALPGEGGHATLAADDADEAVLIARLRSRFGHVSAERVLSGGGLVNLYEALSAEAGRLAPLLTPADVTDESSADPLCHAAVARFLGMLGSFAGNLALTLGAEGGIYLAGGILPRLAARLAGSAFRRRFEAKGRLGAYLAGIPSFLVIHPDPALVGLARIPNAANPTRPHS
jgi:glucokinase